MVSIKIGSYISFNLNCICNREFPVLVIRTRLPSTSDPYQISIGSISFYSVDFRLPDVTRVSDRLSTRVNRVRRLITGQLRRIREN